MQSTRGRASGLQTTPCLARSTQTWRGSSGGARSQHVLWPQLSWSQLKESDYANWLLSQRDCKAYCRKQGLIQVSLNKLNFDKAYIQKLKSNTVLLTLGSVSEMEAIVSRGEAAPGVAHRDVRLARDLAAQDITKLYLMSYYWTILAMTTVGNLPHPTTKVQYVYVIFQLLGKS